MAEVIRGGLQALPKGQYEAAAALGREFSYALLRDVAVRPEEQLRANLAELVRAELLQQKGVPPEARYSFRHALIQDAAYESMLDSKRQVVHERVARVLEADAEVAAHQPEVLAHHYGEQYRRNGELLNTLK